MKKQKFMKLSAFVSDPNLGNSFTAPVTHSGEISVVFRGKNVSIHGWDGSAWTTIYVWNSLDQQFKFDNTYQNYYLKSLTGDEETMAVSFFSIENIENSTPSIAGLSRDVKFYDVEEVPIYTASDANKMLTIMSDGSLAWLLESETYNIDGSPVAPSGPIVWETAFTVVAPGSLYEDEPNGQAMRTGAGGFAHARWDSFLSADDPDQVIVSFWFKANENLITATSRKLFGGFSGYKGVKIQIQGDGSGNEILKSSYSKSSSVSGLTSKSYTTNFSRDVWHNVVMTLDKISGTARTYLDGVMVSEFTGVESTANWVQDFNGSFGLGSDKTNSDNNATYESYDFDSFQMVEGYTLTDSQIASIYNDGSDRDVVIASDM